MNKATFMSKPISRDKIINRERYEKLWRKSTDKSVIFINDLHVKLQQFHLCLKRMLSEGAFAVFLLKKTQLQYTYKMQNIRDTMLI